MDRRRARGLLVAAGVMVALGVAMLVGDWAALGRWARPRVAWLAAFAAGLGFAVAAVLVWRGRPMRSQVAGLRWRTVAFAGVVVGAAALIATSWLLAEADTAVDRGAARVDAIKTGLGAGVGITGIFALLLAVRRQTHQERTAAETTFDATERRVTELYTKAADQLGSAKAAVRLAGLYALERLGENHENQRATIVNLLCAYLRMRYVPPPENPPDDASLEQLDRHEDRVQEAQVRLTARRILHKHISGGVMWSGVDIDLSGANLAGADLSGADLSRANLTNTNLVGANLLNAKLRGATLAGADLTDTLLISANLSGAHLTSANLTRADLVRARLTSADLVQADLTDARLQDTDLSGADLTDANLTNVQIPPGTKLRDPGALPF